MTFGQKSHSLGWFIIINMLLAIAIASRYFTVLPEFPADLLGATFLVVSTWGQMALLVGLLGLISLPILLLPNVIRYGALALIASFGLTALLIDTFVFSQYRFHINEVILKLVMSGQVVDFPLVTWLMVGGAICLLLAGQIFLIRFLDRQPRFTRKKLGRKFSFATFIALLLTHGISIWSSAHALQSVTMLYRYLPVFYPTTATKFMTKHGWIDEEAIRRQKSLSLKTKSDLQYPLVPIHFEQPAKPVNIMILAIDSWRYDSFNPDVTPNLWHYSQNGVRFDAHLSTGNATRAGIFGLFYGMPSTYWHAFLANQQSPVLMDRLQALNYNMGIFGSAKITSPAFDQTVFHNIPNLRLETKADTTAGRDIQLTKDWQKWYEARDKSKPSFSFLFYDAPHGYTFPEDYPHKYEPMLKEINYLNLRNSTDPVPFMNRYKTSVHFVDSLAKKVLDKLKQSGDLENTVVIITGDHGQEINDNKLNYWGHNGNFTDPQVKVPFVMLGPKVSQKTMQWQPETFTSHEDVVPTLMKNYLGATGSIGNYSTGQDLLGAEVKRDWLISSDYNGYAIITKDSILRVGGSGRYHYMNKRNRTLKGQQPNFSHMQQALVELSKFNK